MKNGNKDYIKFLTLLILPPAITIAYVLFIDIIPSGLNYLFLSFIVLFSFWVSIICFPLLKSWKYLGKSDEAGHALQEFVEEDEIRDKMRQMAKNRIDIDYDVICDCQQVITRKKKELGELELMLDNLSKK